MSNDPHAWERRARAKQRDLDTVSRSLDATIVSLDVLAAHLRDLRALINPKGTQCPNPPAPATPLPSSSQPQPAATSTTPLANT